MYTKLSRSSFFRIIMVLLIISTGISLSEAGDVANTKPTNVKYISHFGGGTGSDFSGIAVSGNYAYIADSKKGLEIVDISNPTAPALVGTYETTYNVTDVTISGNYAYIADFKKGLTIVDINNPSSPSQVGIYNNYGIMDVAVSGNYAYIADSFAPDSYDGLAIIDISSPSAPHLVGRCDTGDQTKAVVVKDGYAYVISDDYSSKNDYYCIVIVDVSNPAAPTIEGTYRSVSGPIWDVAVSDDYTYVAGNYLTIVDVSTPNEPQYVSTTSIYEGTGSYARGIAISGDYAYAVGNGLSIVDISDPTDTKLSGFFNSNNGIDSDVTASGKDVAISGNYVYIVDGWNGLVIVENEATTKNTPGFGYIGTLGMILTVFLGNKLKGRY